MTNLAAEVAHARIIYKQQELQMQQQQRERDGRKRKRHGGDEDQASNAANIPRTDSHSRRKTDIAMINTGDAGPVDLVNPNASELLEDPVSPRTVKPARLAIAGHGESEAIGGSQSDTPLATPTADLSLGADLPQPAIPPTDIKPETEEPQLPLAGLKVVIIHIKEKLRDGPPAGEIILDQLREYEARSPLGCEYIISYSGQSLFF